MAQAIYKKYTVDYDNLYEDFKDLQFLPGWAGGRDNYTKLPRYAAYSFDKKTGIYTGVYSSGDAKFAPNGQYMYEVRTSDKNEYGYRIVYKYEARLVSSTPVKNKYIGEVTAEENFYPRNGFKDGYWYVWDRYANTAPKISGENLDLGSKFEDFQVEYIIQDNEGDDVTVEIKVDGATKQSPTKTTLGVRRFYTVSIKDSKIGKHTIEIIATDTNGASAVREYTFNKVNSAPVISGVDENLGAKNTGFAYKYTVTDNESDKVTVIEKINGEVIRTLTNAPLDTELYINISDEKIREFELNQVNTIEIEVTDGTATSYRRVKFLRNNMAPIISGKDLDLGELETDLFYEYSVTDPEKDESFVTISLDNNVITKRFKVVDGQQYKIDLKGLDFLAIPPGRHTLVIEAEDDKGFISQRRITFVRVVKRLVMKLHPDKIIETDELANRALVSTAGMYVARGAELKIEVCNNAFDDEPTWEDATAMALSERAYNFTNETKTADKAGIDIRMTIDKKDAQNLSYISTVGGSFD